MPSPGITPLYGDSGFFRIYVRPPGTTRLDVTFFRDVPTQINQITTTDPFGDAAAQFTFPAITQRDRPGYGDLEWLIPWAYVDVVYHDSDGAPTGWTWEGQIVSEDITDKGVTVQCKGALFAADNFLAAPSFPERPIPYELLIRQAIDPRAHPSLRLMPMVIEWPDDWDTIYTGPTGEAALEQYWFLRPWGVSPGDKWTGLVSRSTGSWEPTLTGYIQSLLGVMFTEDGGQWTLVNRPGRVPVLKVRQAKREPDYQTLEVTVGQHGLNLTMTRDFTQSTNTVYGQGQDLAGTSFSGQVISGDGQTTIYEPFAALPYVYPATFANPRYLPDYTRKEAMLQFPQGLDEISAREVAATQVRKFADPGYTGTITLSIDPIQGGRPFPRFLIKAGMNILVKGARGTNLLFHISECTVNVEDGSVSMTVDTKFRDQLSVAEVRARTRDALDPIRLLNPGKFSVTVQDLILPWSYANGSGVLPSGGAHDATQLLTKLIPPNAKFPYIKWTTKYPPSKYPQYYIRIGPKQSDASKNWGTTNRDGKTYAAIPVRMSQSGTIRLSQIAAYRADGTLFPVEFHLSLYDNEGVTVLDMPQIPSGGYAGYEAGQRYPFHPDAWETNKVDGTEQDNPNHLLPQGANMIIGWGNHYEPAGRSPGLKSAGAPITGKLVDESPWSYDTSVVPGFDKYSVENTRKNRTAGMLYAMIYCDQQVDEPVYFLGRFFIQPPGTV